MWFYWTEDDEWRYQDFDSLYRDVDEYNRPGEPVEPVDDACRFCNGRGCRYCGMNYEEWH